MGVRQLNSTKVVSEVYTDIQAIQTNNDIFFEILFLNEIFSRFSEAMIHIVYQLYLNMSVYYAQTYYSHVNKC